MSSAPLTRESIAAGFAARFGRACEVIARAPGRVNLIGEHTDYNEGFVLPMALEFATWAAVAPRRDDRVRAATDSLGQECEWRAGQWSSATIPEWTAYVAGAATLLRRRGARLGGFELLIGSDVPVGGGLSSSAALTVATAKALVMLSGEAIDSEELADLCRQTEHEFAGVPCGIMDPLVSLVAREGTALLLDCRSRAYEHVPLHLEEHTVAILDSGVRHALAAGEYARRQAECRAAVEYFQRLDTGVRSLRDVTIETVRRHASQMPPLAAARALHVVSENARVHAVAAALRNGDVAGVGDLLAASHRSLRDDYEVSCRELDALVEIARGVPGVAGARMTGGGFGGCVMAIIRREAMPALSEWVDRLYTQRGIGRARVFSSRPGAGASIELG